MIDKSQSWDFGQDTHIFTRSAMGVFMTTESQDLGLTLIQKTVLFDSIVSPSLTGALGPTQTAGWPGGGHPAVCVGPNAPV